MKKKILSIILVLCMVIGLLPAISLPGRAVDTSSMTEFTAASTIFTSGTVYKISDATNLRALATKVNAGNNMTGVTFYLAGNIDLNVGITFSSDGTASGGAPTSWTPIGSGADFSGTFDGDNHTVSGIYITTGDRLGLFGRINSGVVENVTVTNSYINGNASNVGGIVGYCTSGTLENVGVINSYIKGTNDSLGGLVGYSSNSSVSNCNNSAAIISSARYVGGVVGNASGTTITNCSNSGTVNSTYTGAAYVGGVVGTAYNSNVNKCSNTGTVSVSGQRVGGVAGNCDGTVSLYNCYNTGSVSGTGIVGGVLGYFDSSAGSLYNSYNTGSISGSSSSVGGVLGTKLNGTLSNCYNTGSVTGSSNVGGVLGTNTAGTLNNSYWLTGSAVAGIGSGSGTDCYSFSGSDTTWTLSSGVTIGSIGPTTDLRTALNAWVTTQSDIKYLTWDTGTTYPIFGAALAPTYAMSASTLTAFASRAAGYAAPTAQTVTLTNTGNQAITLTQPTATKYTIGALSTTALAVGGTATFTVQPNTGLAVGTHNETISISGSSGTSASVSAQFTVVVALTVSSTNIYANGNAIILAAGTTEDYTCVYIDYDRDGIIDAGVDTIQTITGATGAADAGGYDLTTYRVYGGNESTALAGDTKITMLGGKVLSILGGGYNASASVVSTSITVSAGSVSGIYGGGWTGAVSGNTSITVDAGTAPSIYGGGYDGNVSGSTSVIFNSGSGGTICGGGYNGNVSGNTSITVNDGTITGDIYGGGYYGSVVGSATIRINGGSINGLAGGSAIGIVGSTNIIINDGSFSSTLVGGGQSSGATVGSTSIIINGGSFSNKIYGGGYYGAVSGSSNITVNGGTFAMAIYGGVFTGSLTVGSTNIIISGGTLIGGVDANYHVTGAKSIKITGGTIRGTVAGPTPTNDGTTPVYKTTLTLQNTGSEYDVSGTLTLGGLANGYGLTGVKTTTTGALTFYLPVGASTAAYSTNSTYFTAEVVNTNTNAFIPLLSATPAVTNATVAKTAATQASVSFTLNAALPGTLKVYSALTGGSIVAGITPSTSGTTLTLTHATDIPEGTYYVSQTEVGKTESARLALTVAAPTYTVTLNTNGATSCAALTSYTYGIGATLPTPTKTNANFLGWFDNSDCSGTAVTVIATTDTGAKTYWAKWTEPTPAAGFVASTKTLSGISDGMKYSLDGGTNYTIISGSSSGNIVISGSVTAAHGIKIYTPGNGSSTADSAVQTVTITAADEANIAIAGAKTALAESDFTYTLGEDKDTVKSNVTLPLTGANGTTISWAEKTDTGSNIIVSGSSMSVTRPSSAEGDKTVVITATITKAGGTSETKDLTLVIKALTATEEANAAIAGAKTALDETDLTYTLGDNKNNVTSNVTLPLAGDNVTTLSWIEKTDTGNNITVSGGGMSVTRPSSADGDKTVVITATITKAGGTSETKDLTLVIKALTPSGGGSGAPTPTPDKGAPVIVNDKSYTAGDSKDTTEDGKTVTTVTIDSDKLEKILKDQGNNASVIIPVTSGSDVASGMLTGKIVKSMETQQATLEIQTNTATYTLPASQINIDAVSAQLGASVALSDIVVEIKIAEPSSDTVTVVENASSKGDFSIVVPAVEFTISCTYGDNTVNISSFNAYVERTVSIPDGVDHTRITTGIVVNPDGTTRHVPTRIVVVDGKYYAVINSLTNSTYTVIWHPIEFADVATHWSKGAVNDMGSRMIIKGVDGLNYEPDRNITRAEFAAIIVRALGLDTGIGENSFSDVTSSAWYCGYVETATSYGIIKGYDAVTFGPNDKITREQAMTMISRAMDITGLDAALTDSELNLLLAAYADSSDASNYAKTGIAACLKAGIITGRSSTSIAPKDSITRAEVAVVVQRLLQKSELI